MLFITAKGPWALATIVPKPGAYNRPHIPGAARASLCTIGLFYRLCIWARHTLMLAWLHATNPAVALVLFGQAMPDRDWCWHSLQMAYPPRPQILGCGAAFGRANQVRGETKSNIRIMVVGRVVVTVGRAQVDRLIVPATAALSHQSVCIVA